MGTWLVRVAINLAWDHMRSRARFPDDAAGQRRKRDGRGSGSAGPGGFTERALAAREEVARVWEAVEDLSPQQGSFLFEIFGRNAAGRNREDDGIETGTVKSHLARAVSAIRQRVKRQGPERQTKNIGPTSLGRRAFQRPRRRIAGPSEWLRNVPRRKSSIQARARRSMRIAEHGGRAVLSFLDPAARGNQCTVPEQRAGHHRRVWATAVGFVALAASLPPRPFPRRIDAPVATVSDQELLMQVESSLSK